MRVCLFIHLFNLNAFLYILDHTDARYAHANNINIINNIAINIGD